MHTPNKKKKLWIFQDHDSNVSIWRTALSRNTAADVAWVGKVVLPSSPFWQLFRLFFFPPLHVLFELILENGLLSSLKFKPLQSSKVSTQRRPGSISSALFCFMKKKESKICVCLCVCVWSRTLVRFFRLVGGRSNTLHAAYCPPRSVCGFQSSRSRVIQTIQSQSPACFSYPFLSFLCQRTISVLASLRMCYEMISYLTQRTRHHEKKKKKKKKKIHPHNCCVTPARLAKFFTEMTSLAFFFFFFL